MQSGLVSAINCSDTTFVLSSPTNYDLCSKQTADHVHGMASLLGSVIVLFMMAFLIDRIHQIRHTPSKVTFFVSIASIFLQGIATSTLYLSNGRDYFVQPGFYNSVIILIGVLNGLFQLSMTALVYLRVEVVVSELRPWLHYLFLLLVSLSFFTGSCKVVDMYLWHVTATQTSVDTNPLSSIRWSTSIVSNFYYVFIDIGFQGHIIYSLWKARRSATVTEQDHLAPSLFWGTVVRSLAFIIVSATVSIAEITTTTKAVMMSHVLGSPLVSFLPFLIITDLTRLRTLLSISNKMDPLDDSFPMRKERERTSFDQFSPTSSRVNVSQAFPRVTGTSIELARHPASVTTSNAAKIPIRR
ncbi:uncharacterized protein BJ171DRAFT_494114 [Polychytrium aggregatum]|uniref:uncharacterized protein n=1 Tax=Polychytrium aggregatum TaxID=110093 RepID=UPI0022FE7E05|nr:uncharacterized protein BJ171DRAFT_494114 [Polychytrium aggregatum]KAI9207275.1 hypothetical protein BJ171DRAFT_494114 [Polychytrium aggregatum]